MESKMKKEGKLKKNCQNDELLLSEYSQLSISIDKLRDFSSELYFLAFNDKINSHFYLSIHRQALVMRKKLLIRCISLGQKLFPDLGSDIVNSLSNEL